MHTGQTGASNGYAKMVHGRFDKNFICFLCDSALAQAEEEDLIWQQV